MTISIDDLANRLAEADVAATPRKGDVRVSFHVYNTAAGLDYVANVLEPLVGTTATAPCDVALDSA